MAAPLTALYAGVLGLFLLALGARVSLLRSKLRVGMGHGNDVHLARAIRVHGNAVEWIVPMLLLFLVAELDGAVVGYAFFSAGYNTDVAARSIFLHDLFVTPAARGRGVGHALMVAVAAETVRAGCVSLEWGVHTANARALEFYRRLGAVAAEVRIMGVSGERLRALAAAAF